MHAYQLGDLLDGFFWWELRVVARELGLAFEGGRDAITRRVMDMHAEPPLALRVARVVRRVRDDRPPGSKRRKVRDRRCGVADLAPKFEAAMSPRPAIDAALDAALRLDDDRPVGPVVVVGHRVDEEDVARAAREARHGLVFLPRSMCIDRE